MVDIIRNKFNGQTLSEWIAHYAVSVDPEEGCDAEPFDAIVSNGRHGFGLSGPELDAAVRACLIEMFRAGAHPLQGTRHPQPGYILVTRFGSDPEKAADAIIREWHEAGVDPDVEGLWFAHPEYYKHELTPDSPRTLE